jgi:hypothetical protein
MKLSKHLLFLGAMMMTAVSYAQITVTNVTFPKIGDTLKTATLDANDIPALVMGNVGGPQTWDFSSLNKGDVNKQAVKAPSSGVNAADFPTANLLILSEQDQEQYYISSGTKIELQGFGGVNDLLPFPVAVKFEQKPSLRRAPITFIQTYNENSKFNLDLSGAIIPDSLLAGIGISLDSIRVQAFTQSRAVVNAYGKVKMQGKEIDVLREEVEVITDNKVFLKIPFIGWLDLSVVLQGGGFTLPDGFANLLGADTSTVFNFYSATHKEILVAATYNSNKEFQSVTFADLGGITSGSNEYTYVDSKLFPNPATDYIQVESDELTRGSYYVTITDLSGRIVGFDLIQVDGALSHPIHIQSLVPGTYIVDIKNKKHQTALSSKFVKQ